MFCGIQSYLITLAAKNKIEIILPSMDGAASKSKTLLFGEEFLIEDMLMNLMKNAVEASPEGGAVIVDYNVEQAGLRITIHNQGAIPEVIRGRFFEKDATAGKIYGTGLGTYSAQPL